MQAYSMDGTRKERTNWRDERISARHRDWGFNCPAVDLDFLMVEYNHGLPVGLVEYKSYQARMPSYDHATYRALSALATGYSRVIDGTRVHDPLPFLLVFYWADQWTFRVHPVNSEAKKHYSNPELMSEYDYVTRLYKLRRLTLAGELKHKLNKNIAQAAA